MRVGDKVQRSCGTSLRKGIRMERNRWRLSQLGLVFMVALALAGGAGQAQAAGNATVYNAGCADQVLAQPFTRWADVSSYFLAPNGGFESGSTGWKLNSGASVVSGNESFLVHSSTDKYSLALPAGSSATSSSVCVGTLDPTMRIFVQNTGSRLSTLKIEVTYTTLLGLKVTSLIGVVTSGWAWQPVLPQLLLANLTSLPLVTNGATLVSFRFTPQDAGGNWKIDDFYVDPFKGV